MQNLYITNLNSDSDPTPIKTSYPVRIHPFVNSDKKCSINEETNKTTILGKVNIENVYKNVKERIRKERNDA